MEWQEKIKVLEEEKNCPKFHPGPVFTPDERILLEFGNIDYKTLRESDPKYSGFMDLNEVKLDMQRMQEGMMKFGFNTDSLR